LLQLVQRHRFRPRSNTGSVIIIADIIRAGVITDKLLGKFA
jgi:hypothetical protein